MSVMPELEEGFSTYSLKNENHCSMALPTNNAEGQTVTSLLNSPNADLNKNDRLQPDEIVLDTDCQKLIYNVPPASKHFTGRSDELKILQNFVENEYEVGVSPKFAITGLAGTGKSELVQKFIQNNLNQFRNIIWVNAESKIAILETFKVLASRHLFVSLTNKFGKDRSNIAILDDVYATLELTRTLVVFDNVQDSIQEYFPCLSQNCSNVYIVITSRDGAWNKQYRNTHIRLTSLSHSDSVILAEKLLPLSKTPVKTDRCVSILLSELTLAPLYIVQTFAYASNKQSKPSDKTVVEYSKETTETSIEHQIVAESLSYLQPKPKPDLICDTSDAIENHESYGILAVTLLKILTYFAYKSISYDIIKNIKKELVLRKSAIKSAVLLLQRYSIINFQPRKLGSPLRITVIKVVQDFMRQRNFNEEPEYLELGITCLQQKMDFDSIEHAMSLWKFACKYDSLVAKFPKFPFKIGVNLIALMRINDAQKFAENAYTRLQKVFSKTENHGELINLETLLGTLMLEKNQIDKSRLHFDITLKNAETQCVPPNVVLKLHVDIADTLYEKCKFKGALEKYQVVLGEWGKISRNVDNPEILQIRLCIGKTFRQLKKYDQALKTLQEIIYILNLQENHANQELVVEANYYKALTKGNLGELETALDDLQKLYRYAKLNLHPSHRLVLDIHIEIAVYQYRMGQFKDSLDTSKKVYKLSLECYGEEHHKTLVAKRMIYKNLFELGDHDNALVNITKIYETYKRVFGKDFFHTVAAYAVMGMISSQMGKQEESIEILKNCLDSKWLNAYSSKFVLSEIKFYVALSLTNLNNITEAFELLTEAKEDMENISQAFFLKSRINQARDNITRQIKC